MKRTLTAVLALIATVCGATVARADLDSLLGDWTAAASQDAGSIAGTEVLFAPASQGIVDIGSDFADDSDDLVPAPRPAGKRSSPSAANKTLASKPPHATPVAGYHPLAGQPTAATNPVTEGFSVVSPTMNPYCTQAPVSSDCQCKSGAGCSSCGCGELLSRNAICHLRGESECRPHRSPVLPPPGTLLQMFRSKNSYSGIWAGYADETRTRLRNTSPHINGTWNSCDDGGLIEPGCNTCGPGCGH